MKKEILKLIEQEVEKEINNITKLPVKQKTVDDYSLGGIAKQKVVQQFEMLNPEQQKRYVEILKRSKELYEKAEEWENLVGNNWMSREIPTGAWSKRYNEPGTGQGLKRKKSRVNFVYYPEMFSWTQKIVQADLINKIGKELAKKDAENALKRRMDKVEDELGKKREEKIKKRNLDANYLAAVSLYDILYYIKSNYGIGGSSKPQEVKEELRLVKGEPEKEKGSFSSSELRALVNDIKEIEKYAYKGNIEELQILRLPFFIWFMPYQKQFLMNKDNKALLDAMVKNNDGFPVTKEVLKNFVMAGPPLEDTAPYDSSRLIMRHETILDMMGIDPENLKPAEEEPTVLPFKKSLEESIKLDEQLLKDIIEKAIEERLSLSSIKKGLAGLGIAATMASSGANAANYEPVQTDTGRPAMVLKRIAKHSDADDFNTIQDKLEKLRKENPSKFVSVAVKSEGDAWVPYYQISDKPVIDPQIKKKAEEQGREIRTLQIFEIDEMPEDYLKIINDRVHGLGGQVAQIVRFGGLVDSSGKENMSQPPNDVVVFYTVPGVQRESVLREELTKSEIKKLIGDEITAFARQQLKKMVEEELEKALAKTDIKNKVGDISKDILKKLYKDLSLHHTYVIDRVKL